LFANLLCGFGFGHLLVLFMGLVLHIIWFVSCSNSCTFVGLFHGLGLHLSIGPFHDLGLCSFFGPFYSFSLGSFISPICDFDSCLFGGLFSGHGLFSFASPFHSFGSCVTKMKSV